MKKYHQFMKIAAKLPQDFLGGILGILKEHGISPDDLTVKRAAAAREIVELEEGSRTALQYVSTRTLDRDGDIMVPSGGMLDQFKKTNMQVFWNHDYGQLIGSDDSIKRDHFGFIAKTRYAKHEAAEARANLVWELKQQGHLKTNSVGFGILAATVPGHADFDKTKAHLAKQWPDMADQIDEAQRFITKWMMIEHSDVGVPSNLDSNVIAVAKNYGLKDEDIEDMFCAKGQLKGLPMGDPKALDKKAGGDTDDEDGDDGDGDQKARKPEPKPPAVVPIPARIKVPSIVHMPLTKEDIRSAVAEAIENQLALQSGKV